MVCRQLFFQIRLLFHKREQLVQLSTQCHKRLWKPPPVGMHASCFMSTSCFITNNIKHVGSFYRILEVGTFFFLVLASFLLPNWKNTSRKKNHGASHLSHHCFYAMSINANAEKRGEWPHKSNYESGFALAESLRRVGDPQGQQTTFYESCWLVYFQSIWFKPITF